MHSVTRPAAVRFTGSVSTGNRSFFTKLRCSHSTPGARASASENASQGSIPARKYSANPERLGSLPNRASSTMPKTKK